ncbi:hypothetical protein ABZ454_36335 [Streptomyces sp. NPDC005803]|uniref:hypothetical protein n=1 Tax=Streptomyces sp. NPDC005803 TaxID=3154297 RepID=UPI0033C325DC
MTRLLDLVVEAHGGLDRWREARTIRARGSIGGLLWTLRSQQGILATVDMTVDVQRQRVVYEGFTSPELCGVFTPDRVAIERRDGEVVAERTSPRQAFVGHGSDTPWDELHVLYFAGYAMWNYLTAPYLLTHPGVVVEELEPWEEAGENRRRLRATFPDTIATHAREQIFHYDAAGLLRRHDYAAEVLGGAPAAHLCEKHETASGLVFPTHRYVLPMQEDARVLPEPTLVTIDLTEISVG